jgi:hypothetical protein
MGAGVTFSGHADACGGTFCDSGPRAMPVDQTGENILFVMSADKVEAHIQIQYKGEASRFAWVVPVPALPEFEVGSQQLFTNLLNGTVPTYGFTTTRDMCAQSLPRNTSTSAPGSAFGAEDGAHGGPSVVVHQTVGAFDVIVLQGGTAQEVVSWLNTNGYQMPPNAPMLLEGYVADHFMFVAVKLTGGAGVDEIHPLVVRYTGTEPCVPLKLTSVAAVENMGVRTFFLGDTRVVPMSYKHVELNAVRIDWMSFAPNYTDVLTHAVDSPVANGKAFATEYAGPSTAVTPSGLVDPRWDANAFAAAQPDAVVSLLEQQGLLSCAAAACTYNHPLVLPLLRDYLPAPAGVAEGAFYDCTPCYAAQINAAAWKPAEFAAELQKRIIAPGQHAAQILSANPYLTRMLTTISPAEMTEDPTFKKLAGLPDVTARRQATQRILCNNASVMVLPDGREVAMGPSASWPTFPDSMPWAERIQDFSGDTPVDLVDNHAAVEGELGAWNESQGYPAKDGCICSMPGRRSAENGAGTSLGMGLGLALAWRGRSRRVLPRRALRRS